MSPEPVACSRLKEDLRRHLQYSLATDPTLADRSQVFYALALAVRDRLSERWLRTQRACYEMLAKRVYYLSLEFLPGRFLRSYLVALQMEETAREVLREMGHDLEDLEEEERDAGLGNGGLGRLASCFMDSFATLQLPGYGYGIRYDYGIFHQRIVDGEQQEECDNWMRAGSPWEIQRPEVLFPVGFYGRTETWDDAGNLRHRWVPGEQVLAQASDFLVPGYGSDYVTHLRLWVARSSREFNLAQFNRGDYIGAVESQVLGENISKVLYPSDEAEIGRELRLKQQHFFVSATLQDILRRFVKQHRDWRSLPDQVAIQLNDTHPTLAVPELMRLLMDREGLGWDEAWEICRKTFSYTNHTVLPEALETWPVHLLQRLLPRHLEIIYEINFRFIEDVKVRFPDDSGLLSRVSLIQEGAVKAVRMANLAIVAGHAVNGVAALHTDILRRKLFQDFERLFPGRLRNVTNGVTPRRWLHQCNPALGSLITSAIGDGWIRDLDELRRLEEHVEDGEFRKAWMAAKRENKRKVARYVLRKCELGINPDTLFDVQVKRIHEYKRQLMNILHVVALYRRILDHPAADLVPRTVMIGGKAAPAYRQAKLIIRLVNAVAARVNRDPAVKGRLRVVFLPNYCVSQAEKVIPGTDLSEQISTAGMEASGTGNMKFALNGALTIGTLDGANVEIRDEVGEENIFIFGLTADEVAERRARGYHPRGIYDADEVVRTVLDMIGGGWFSPDDPGRFRPIVQALLDWGDYFMVLADFRSYLECQERVADLYRQPDRWARLSVLNCARIGKFSSDRSIREYARDIWRVEPLDVVIPPAANEAEEPTL